MDDPVCQTVVLRSLPEVLATAENVFTGRLHDLGIVTRANGSQHLKRFRWWDYALFNQVYRVLS